MERHGDEVESRLEAITRVENCWHPTLTDITRSGLRACRSFRPSVVFFQRPAVPRDAAPK
jgi:hypothetical protein